MNQLLLKRPESLPEFLNGGTSSNDGSVQTSTVSKAIALTIAFYIGTGGVIPSRASSVALNSFTTPAFAVRKSENEDGGENWFAASLKEKLSLIRHFLSASMTDLAKMLLVQRPTVYAWVSDSTFPQAANVERVSQLFNTVASLHKTIGQPVGSFLKEPLSRNRSLLDVLSDAQIDERASQTLLLEIKRALDRVNAEKLKRYKPIQDSANELGYTTPRQRPEADLETFLPH